MIPWLTTLSHWAHYDDALPSGPRDTSPSHGVTNPSLDSCQPNRHFRRPVVHLYSHPVTLWRLIHPKHSYGIQELHALMVEGRDTWHWQSSSKWTTRSFVLVLGLGLVHHIILLMMWSRYQRHPMSIARKPWLSVDQRASQLEAH